MTPWLVFRLRCGVTVTLSWARISCFRRFSLVFFLYFYQHVTWGKFLRVVIAPNNGPKVFCDKEHRFFLLEVHFLLWSVPLGTCWRFDARYSGRAPFQGLISFSWSKKGSHKCMVYIRWQGWSPTTELNKRMWKNTLTVPSHYNPMLGIESDVFAQDE